MKIYVATNHMADFVEAFLGDGSKYGVKLIFSRECKPLGTCGPLTLLKANLTEPFQLMNGDVLTKLNFRAFYDFAVAQDSLLAVANQITRFASNLAKYAGLYLGKNEAREQQGAIQPAIFLCRSR